MKLLIDRNIGTCPTYTTEVQAAMRAYYKRTATPEQIALAQTYNQDQAEYERRERILHKLPCPVCDSTFTYTKKNGAILHCRKCGSDSEIEYKN